MKANSTENLLLDQLFKIQKSDENISNYLIDCGSAFNSVEIKKPPSQISGS